MATYIKTITIGKTSGGKMITPDNIDPLVNGTLEEIQNNGGNILDVKINLASASGNYVSTYLIIYNADKPFE